MIIFPYQKFFKPNSKFTKYMIYNHENDLIYDVGAGIGHVSKILFDQKLKVYPIDLNIREEYDFPVHFHDATNFAYECNSVILFARPCHGFFVQDTIDQALLRKVKTILYIGVSRNKNPYYDLGDYYKKFRIDENHVGEDKEKIWRYDV